MARIQTTQAREAIDRALLLLAPTPAATAGSVTTGLINPAAAPIQASNSRTILDLLVASDPKDLLSGELNLKHMTESLFDWHGQKRSTKTLLHAFHNALQVPGRYDHAIELTAFLSAMSPMLDADRLARLYSLTTQVDSVYAPARYTVSLSNKLQSVLAQYPQPRIEQLAQTLWIDAHRGRWWDMTDGIVEAAAPAAARGAAGTNPVKTLIETGRVTYTDAAARRFAKLDYDARVHETIKAYVKRANSGADVDPDTSVLASVISWLPILDRPESPIAPLINTLRSIREALGEHYDVPAKPKSFRNLFPDVRIYGDMVEFLYHPEVLATDGIAAKSVRFELIRTPGQLQENRDYMGNCTWSYKDRMEKGTHAIYRLHYRGAIYNAAMSVSGGAWKVGEINSRFNAGRVPEPIKKIFGDMVKSLSTQCAAEAHKNSEVAALRVKARFSVL